MVTMGMRAAAAALAIALAASAATAQDKPLRVGLDGTFAPHAMPKLGGGVEGFNVDLATEIGKRLGRKMDIVAQQFSGLIPGMQAGQFDFIVAPTTVTKERAEQMLFVEGYIETDFVFVTKKGTKPVATLDDLKGRTVAVNKGSAYDIWARENEAKHGFKVASFGTQPDATQAVLSGQADTTFAGITVLAWAAKQNPQIELGYVIKTGSVFSMPFRKDDTAMRNKVEEAIECMKLDGSMAKLADKWFGIKPAAGSALVTVQPGYGIPGMPGYDPAPHTPKCN